MKIVNAIMEKNPCYTQNVRGADSRYSTFQKRGPLGLVLHSVGCAQPSAAVFVKRWNNTSYDRACVHAFIDAQTQETWQTLPWNFRGWHCGGSANNTHVGVEMCEPKWLKYQGVTDRFTVPVEYLESARAQVCKSYAAAVELAAHLADIYGWDVTKPGVILSHAEAGRQGLASKHTDPEHLWTQLGLPYTMDTFRRDVAEALGVVTPGPEQPKAATCTVTLPVLRRGDASPACRWVMLALADLGYYSGTISSGDKTFGPKMEAAVIAYQKAKGLDVDGVVGPQVYAALAGLMA